jgi:UDP-N-acetylglucosamine--N-acetylmuramyl-(pentapeptide) pyrophosphoryl-undecaprenol N-acetylglucosamine transferase
MEAMRAIMAGGGTGGHVIPAIAIARELKALYQAEILFIGTQRGIENRLVPQAGFELRHVEIGALKNVSAATRARTFLNLPGSVAAAWKIVRRFHPDVMIGVGGYASGPAMLAAWLRRVPILAFEPNVVPGFANRAISRLVSAAAVQFEESRRYFRNPRVTGIPVRPEFFRVPQKVLAGSPTLLVFGGSQGAHAINHAVASALPALRLAFPRLRIIHQTGERDYRETQAAYVSAGLPAEVSAFIDNMPKAFAQADLLLCRSGASTVAEIMAAGKPAILVPFPRAADDHQRRNAEALARHGAAMLIPESELTAEKLSASVSELLTQPEKLATMSQAARSLAHTGAASEIARMAAELAGIKVEAAKSSATVQD